MVSTYILQETLSQERHLFFIPESLIVFYAQRSLSVLYLYIHTTRAILFHLRSEERKGTSQWHSYSAGEKRLRESMGSQASSVTCKI